MLANNSEKTLRPCHDKISDDNWVHLQNTDVYGSKKFLFPDFTFNEVGLS